MIKHLPDGRPINELKINGILESIERNGVHGHHLNELRGAFNSTDAEVQVALSVSHTVWQKLVGEYKSKVIPDPSVALLAVFYLKNPHEWPIKYLKDASHSLLKGEFEKTFYPMLVGRSRNSAYRWENNVPKDSVRKLLSYLTIWIETGDKKAINNYMNIVNEESQRRDVDLLRDQLWENKNE